MTPSDLKYRVTKANPASHFFSRDTMKFFGDTMRNYGVRTADIQTLVCGYGVVDVECWELYRKRPVKNNLQSSVYFDKISFKRFFPLEKI